MLPGLVIIPTYNEKENIEAILQKVFFLKTDYHVLVVDDGSPDGTGKLVKDLFATYPNKLFIEERTGKQGLGTAYVHGFKWALERGYHYIFEMDADFSHNPEDLPRLQKACENGADVAVGSRYSNGVNVVNWPMGRVLMSYYASKYVRMITGMKVADATAGFICWTAPVLQKIVKDGVKFVGYAFQIEMKFKTVKYGFKLVEVPIIFTDRTQGQSKMSSKIFKEAIFGVISMKIGSWFRKWE